MSLCGSLSVRVLFRVSLCFSECVRGKGFCIILYINPFLMGVKVNFSGCIDRRKEVI